jgi:hypothetical protein
MASQKPITNQELLIRLDERVQNLTTDVKEVKDTLQLQLAEMRAEVMLIKAFITKNDLENKVKQWDEASAWVKDFRKTWVMITSLVGLIAGLVGYFMNNIMHWIQNRGG